MNQPRLLYPLLLLYLLGRALQPLAGQVPNLLLVTLHVLPPALFAAIQGRQIYRTRGILVFFTVCLGVATFFESLSLRTGFPFGHYKFTPLMGPQIAGLPLLLALAYVGMGYLAWIVSLALLGRRAPSVFLTPALAALLMTTWDLSMEPVWAGIDRAWVWRDGGLFYGVPLANFAGWLLTSYAFYQLFALYLCNRRSTPPSPTQARFATAFYALSALGNLLVIAPASLGGVFVDATGKTWFTGHILRTSRLISLCLMLPMSLLAWSRIQRKSYSIPEA